MSDSQPASANRAVFLSYASQDAEAAKRICEALRTVGVEVWFDQNELVGGDAWDQKIRRQIKDCTLFIPVISANTQARTEGYFRLEWRLADQRTHLMAKGRPFLLPVVIDGTRDAEAHVPDSFTEVQWTRLPAGETTTAFCARVKKLLEGSPLEAGGSRPTQPDEGRVPLTETKRSRHVPKGALAAGAALVLALLALGGYEWRKRAPDSAPSNSVGKTHLPTEEKAAGSLSEAKRMARQAQEIFLKAEVRRGELDAAAALCERAVGLDSSDAEIWATFSEVETWRVFFGGDRSPERQESARSKAARAINLAPQSFEARRAQASYQVGVLGRRVEQEAKLTLRALRSERPKDRQTLLMLGLLLRSQDKIGEAVACLEELAAQPGSAAQAYNEIGWAWLKRDRDESNAAIDRSIAAQPFTGNVALKVYLAQSWLGDLDLALATLKKLPASTLLEDGALATAIRVYRWRNEPDQIISLLNAVPRDWINWSIDGPKAAITGDAHEKLNHPALARNDWKKALDQVEQRLTASANDWKLNFWKAYLLAALGDRAGSDEALRLAKESANDAGLVMRWISGQPDFLLAYNFAPRLASPDEVVSDLERRAQTPAAYLALADLRLNPSLEEARKLPRFQTLLARMETDLRFSPKGGPSQSPLASVPDPKSVVVLPFANLSGDPAQEYFSDGLTEEILIALSNERDLRVPGRTSAFAFKSKTITAPEIAHALNVAQVVEGSVRKSGNQVKISITLTRASDGFSEPLGSFTEKLDDIFALQEKVARVVVEKLTRRNITVAGTAVPTKNPAAYDAYLRARAVQTSSSTVSVEGMRLFAEAVQLDPEFALAWARLAESQVQLRRGGVDRSEKSAASARDAARAALRRNANLPEAHLAMASVALWVDFDLDAAEWEIDSAQRLRPNDPESPALRALISRARGQWGESLVALATRAVEADPQNAYTLVAMGQTLSIIGRFAAADGMFARSWELSPDATPVRNRAGNYIVWTGDIAAGLRMLDAIPSELDHGLVHQQRASIFADSGKFEAAIAEYERVRVGVNALAWHPSGPQGSRNLATYRMAQLESRLGHTARAVELFNDAKTALQQFTEDFPDQPSGLIGLAVVHALHGENSEAHAAIDAAMRIVTATHDAAEIASVQRNKAEVLGRLGEIDAAVSELRSLHEMGYGFGYRLRFAFEWEPLRGDPKFQQLMKEAEALADAQPRPKK